MKCQFFICSHFTSRLYLFQEKVSAKWISNEFSFPMFCLPPRKKEVWHSLCEQHLYLLSNVNLWHFLCFFCYILTYEIEKEETKELGKEQWDALLCIHCLSFVFTGERELSKLNNRILFLILVSSAHTTYSCQVEFYARFWANNKKKSLHR